MPPPSPPVVDAPGLVAKEHNGPWMPVGSGLVIAPSGIAQHVRCAGSWSITAACVPRAALGAFVAALPATALRGDVLPERMPVEGLMILRDGIGQRPDQIGRVRAQQRRGEFHHPHADPVGLGFGIEA